MNTGPILAVGTQLAQALPLTTGAVMMYSASFKTEIYRMLACNTASAGATFRIFHDDNGTNYSSDCALYYDISVAPKTTFSLDAAMPGAGLGISPGGTIGVQTSLTGAFCFTIYGSTRPGR